MSKVSLGFHRNMERLASDYKFIGENQNNSGVHASGDPFELYRIYGKVEIISLKFK